MKQSMQVISLHYPVAGRADVPSSKEADLKFTTILSFRDKNSL